MQVALPKAEEGGSLVFKVSSAPQKASIFAKPWPWALLYLFTGTLLQWSYGLSSNLIQANLMPLAKVYHATPLEMAWLVAAYMAPNVSLSIILVKLRMQYGLRIFAQLSMILFFLGTVINGVVLDFERALFVRFLCGVVASPISSLAFLYVIEAFSADKKFTIALSVNLMNISLAVPLARIISPILIDYSGTSGLYSLELLVIALCFLLILCLPLTLAPKQKLIEFLDLYSYTLIALGLGLTAVMAVVGPYYGWTSAPWIGISFLVAIICLVSAALIELNRKNPLINLRWVFSADMLHIAFVLFMFRLLLSEQSSMAANFFAIFGLSGSELGVIYAFIGLGVLVGGVSCVFFYRPGREDIFHIVALLFLAIGAYMDSHLVGSVTNYKIYASQALIGCGGTLFMPPTMSKGFAKALTSGQKYVISFIAVFLVTQNSGALMGGAFFNEIAQNYQTYFYQKLFSQSLQQNPLFLPQEVTEEAKKLIPYVTDQQIREQQAEKMVTQKLKKQADLMAYSRVFQYCFYIAIAVLLFILAKMFYHYTKYQHLKTARARAKRREAKARRFSFRAHLKQNNDHIHKCRNR